MYLCLLLSLCFGKIVYGAVLQPDVVYDMRDSFTNGEIKSEHLIECGDTKNWMDINFTSVDTNGWFQWNTQEDIKYVEISVNGSSNEWLYFVHDADKDAAQGLLSISSLIEMCYECGKDTSTNSIDINFENNAFSRGTYWIGANGDFIISVQCQYYDKYIITDDEILMISLIIISIVLFVSGCVSWAIFNNYQHKKKTIESRSMTKSFSSKALETAMTLSVEPEQDNNNNNNNNNNGMVINEEEKEQILSEAVISSNILYGEILATLDETLEDEDLDAYQILAFRQNYEETRKLESSFFMFRFTRYQQSLFTVLVTSSLQIFGITVTLYSVAISYFEEGDGASCEWQQEVWAQDWPYKLLAFFWSWIISLSVAVYVNSVETNGLNELIKLAKKQSKKEDGLDVDEYYTRLNLVSHFVNVPLLEFGIVVNYYTLTLAIIGSFFLIYESESGADALDMILNAVALYFMIELDDMLVGKKDIRDLKKHKKQIMQSIINNSIEAPETVNVINAETKCALRCGAIVKYTAYIIIVLSMIIAPFAILTCW